jgi:hypothetical protein
MSWSSSVIESGLSPVFSLHVVGIARLILPKLRKWYLSMHWAHLVDWSQDHCSSTCCFGNHDKGALGLFSHSPLPLMEQQQTFPFPCKYHRRNLLLCLYRQLKLFELFSTDRTYPIWIATNGSGREWWSGWQGSQRSHCLVSLRPCQGLRSQIFSVLAICLEPGCYPQGSHRRVIYGGAVLSLMETSALCQTHNTSV